MANLALEVPPAQQAERPNSVQDALIDEYLRQAEARSCPKEASDAPAGKRDQINVKDYKFDGQLFLIGGVADTSFRELLDKLPKNAKVAVVGLASSVPVEKGEGLARGFEDSGIDPANITIVSSFDAPEGSKYKHSAELPSDLDAIYFGGGDQAVLKQRFADVDKLKELLKKGAIVAGNSAGTAVMPVEMITGGDAKKITHSPGFGLFPWITDTHVHERNREDRDITALYEIANGKVPVIGVDTDTRVNFKWEGDQLIGEVGGENAVRIFMPMDQELKMVSDKEVKPAIVFGTEGAGKDKAALVYELKKGDRFVIR